jgi:hypothetical protein
MADEQQLAVLRQGSDAWNAWREQNPTVRVDLSKADLCGANLSEARARSASRSASVWGQRVVRASERFGPRVQTLAPVVPKAAQASWLERQRVSRGRTAPGDRFGKVWRQSVGDCWTRHSTPSPGGRDCPLRAASGSTRVRASECLRISCIRLHIRNFMGFTARARSRFSSTLTRINRLAAPLTSPHRVAAASSCSALRSASVQYSRFYMPCI